MSKSQTTKIASTHEAWDEGDLGRDAAYAKRVTISPIQRAKLDDKLGLQPISIRLPKELLDDLKSIARLNGLGYQPLIRQVLTRFAHSELKALARDSLAGRLAKSPKGVDATALAPTQRPRRAA